MKEAYRELMEKLNESDRLTIAAIFFDTSRDIIVDNAPKELTENELKRYVYEKMYKEPAPRGVWE